MSEETSERLVLPIPPIDQMEMQCFTEENVYLGSLPLKSRDQVGRFQLNVVGEADRRIGPIQFVRLRLLTDRSPMIAMSRWEGRSLTLEVGESITLIMGIS